MADRLIYALVDPRTDAIRYIGKSSSGLARPNSHLEPKRIASDGNKHKARWLGQLAAAGLRAVVVVLEDVDGGDEDLCSSEVLWIAAGRWLGWPLTNLTAGGDGAAGHRPSEASRAKMSAAHRGQKRSLETCARISAAKRGRPRPDVAARNRSDAQRQATSRAFTGRPRPDVAARNASPEQRAAVSSALVGRRFSAETIRRMSAAQRRRWARDKAER